MSVTTFTVVGGQMMRQVKDGVVHDFVPDPLGSVVMVQDSAGAAVYKAEYDPYGNVQSETGTNPSSLGYVGTLGYIKDSATSMYVRARYLLSNLGRWLTKDPLWPEEPGYVYAGGRPIDSVDFLGLMMGVGKFCGPTRRGPPPPENDSDGCCQTHDDCLKGPCEWFNPIRKFQCDCQLCFCIAATIKKSCGMDLWCLCRYLQVMLWACQECLRLGNPIPNPTPPNFGWLCFIHG